MYYDAKDNFNLANDPYVTTGVNGTTGAVVPAGATGGQLVLVGGTDSSTGIANEIEYTAPYDASSISPLTTLVNSVMQQANGSEATATAYVDASLGLAPSSLVDSQNSIVYALGGDASASQIYTTTVEVDGVADGIASLLGGQSGAPSISSLSLAAFHTMASVIANTQGGPLVLSSAPLLQYLIQQVATGAGLTVADTDASDTAQMMAGLVQYVQAIPNPGTSAYLD